MAEYKDVEQVKKSLRMICNDCWNRNSPSKCPDDCGITETIKLLDSVPVVHGHWIDGAEEARCSVCGRNLLDYVSYTEYCEVYEYPTFCPNCGARMDGKDGDQE